MTKFSIWPKVWVSQVMIFKNASPGTGDAVCYVRFLYGHLITQDDSKNLNGEYDKES